jgi:peroxiredoxin
MKNIIVALLCATVLVAAAPQRRAPGFCLIDTNGQWQDLADYRGKVVVVEFTQTMCPHCGAFSTVLKGLKAKYGEKLAVLAIANPPDTTQTMSNFAREHKLTYPLLFDQGQVAYAYVRSQSIDLPAVFLVDGNGMIRNTWQNGPLNKDIFEGEGLAREIDKLLGGNSTPAKK